MSNLNEEEEFTHTSPRGSMRGGRALLTIACIVIVVAGMKAAASFFVPVMVAVFLAVLSFPLMNWLIRHRVPHSLALALTVVVIFSAVAPLIYGTGVLISSFWRDVPMYAERAKTLVDSSAGWLESKGVTDAKVAASQIFDMQGIIDFARQQDVMNRLTSVVGTTFGTVVTLVASCVVVLLVTLFILMEAPGTAERFEAVRQAGGPNLSVMVQSAHDIQKFLGVKTLISVATGVLVVLWCMMFDLRYPLLWGILAFLFNYIPAVGSTAAGLPAIIEALVVHGFGSAVGVALGYALINFCLDSLLQPMLMGRRFGISGLVVVVSVVFWGWLWGPVGMFLAVPLTMMMKVFLENTEEFEWISVAMAKKKFSRSGVILETLDNDDQVLGGGAATEPPR
ncbi:AI-2E family transporter [Phragmitibacter flavus]|uniref:AI-2E family transporter n=1 Tax=Phragmitibacter flavus TaxID=2576071 RepID=A0A5R8KBK5_9BACT|nr:AI-2E family transporter [Phragmitibacter flavus]TLD69681.1 AI-2E family transporter [Phragmitibacter flavus]